MSIEFEISYMLQELYGSYPLVCAKLDCPIILNIFFFAISGSICDSSGLTSVECPYDSLPEMLHVKVFSY